MANRSNIRGVRLAVESTFGSISATTGLVDVSGLTWLSDECDRASITSVGEQEANQPEHPRGGFHVVAPEPITRWSGGSRVEHRTGVVLTLTSDVRGLGSGASGITTLADMTWWKCLRTVLSDAGEPAAETDLVSADNDDNSHTPTTLASLTEGELMATNLDGRVQAVVVTDKTTDVLYSPGLSNTVDASQVFRLLRTLYLDKRVLQSSLGGSLAARVEGDGWRDLLTGGRLQSFRLYVENGRLKLDREIMFAHGQDASADSDVADGTNLDSIEPLRTDGAVMHYRQVRTVISEETPASRSASKLADTEIYLDGWELKCSFTLHPKGTGSTLIGISEFEVSDPVVELTITPADETLDAVVADDMIDRIRGRMIAIPFSPLSSGNGGALILPNGVLQTDPKPRDLDSPIVRTRALTYAAGQNLCVDATTGQGQALLYLGFTRGA